MPKAKKQKTHHHFHQSTNHQHKTSNHRHTNHNDNAGINENNILNHEEIWDDSALLRSWDDAVKEYEFYHSIHARGEDVDEVLRRVEEEELKASEIHRHQQQDQQQPRRQKQEKGVKAHPSNPKDGTLGINDTNEGNEQGGGGDEEEGQINDSEDEGEISDDADTDDPHSIATNHGGHPPKGEIEKTLAKEEQDDPATLRRWSVTPPLSIYSEQTSTRARSMKSIEDSGTGNGSGAEQSNRATIAAMSSNNDPIPPARASSTTTQQQQKQHSRTNNDGNNLTTTTILDTSTDPPIDTAQILENVKMAYYWAGYYSGLYDAAAKRQGE